MARQHRDRTIDIPRVEIVELVVRSALESDGDRFWQNIDLDLTGATLTDLNLSFCTIRTARLQGATFIGSAGFMGATFTNRSGIDNATFIGNAWFGGATFTNRAGFDGATFTRGAQFAGATFTGDAEFDGATFTVGAQFGGATFERGGVVARRGGSRPWRRSPPDRHG